MKPEEYINSVVGKPWVSRAEGPYAFDCWGLVLDSFRKIDGIELPQLSSYADIESEKHVIANEAFSSEAYKKCEPKDGAIMTAFMGDKLVHVGRCLLGHVVHATEGLNVRFDKYRVIKATNQRVEYYQYAINTSS